MPVIDNRNVKTYNVPGMIHQSVANRDAGVNTMEVWKQTMRPGAATPVHCHDCEEVIVVVKGSGTVTIEGEATEFGPDSTLILPPNAVHQIVNTGDEELFFIASLGMGPVRLKTADGQPAERPWLVT